VAPGGETVTYGRKILGGKAPKISKTRKKTPLVNLKKVGGEGGKEKDGMIK